jgi:hypothetical protein
MFSFAPSVAFVAAAVLLVRFRDVAADAARRALTSMTDPVPAGARAVLWRPGRNLCLVLVWASAAVCLAVAVSSII